MIRSAAAGLMSLALVAAVAQVDVNRLGPRVGERALEFRLTDQHGRVQTLSTVAGPKGTMLVFFRSADW